VLVFIPSEHLLWYLYIASFQKEDDSKVSEVQSKAKFCTFDPLSAILVLTRSEF